MSEEKDQQCCHGGSDHGEHHGHRSEPAAFGHSRPETNEWPTADQQHESQS